MFFKVCRGYFYLLLNSIRFILLNKLLFNTKPPHNITEYRLPRLFHYQRPPFISFQILHHFVLRRSVIIITHFDHHIFHVFLFDFLNQLFIIFHHNTHGHFQLKQQLQHRKHVHISINLLLAFFENHLRLCQLDAISNPTWKIIEHRDEFIK